MNLYEERKEKVERHGELPLLWKFNIGLMAIGVIWDAWMTVVLFTDRINHLWIFGFAMLVGTAMFSVLLYGVIRLTKWVILPGVAALVYFAFTDAYSFWIVLLMGVSYAYLRIKIKWFSPAPSLKEDTGGSGHGQEPTGEDERSNEKGRMTAR